MRERALGSTIRLSDITPVKLAMLGVGLTAIATAFLLTKSPLFEGSAFWDLLLADRYAAYAIGLAALMLAACRRAGQWGREIPEVVGRHPGLLAIGVTVTLMALTLGEYRNYPLSMDEYAPWLQARIFAEGRLTGSYPPELMDSLISPTHQGVFIIANKATGAVLSVYWPGFALLLTPFMFLGIPWACNPIIVGLTLVVLSRLARDLFGTNRAVGWVLLFAISTPALTLNGISYYSMPAHLLFNVTFCWLLIKQTRRHAFLAGLLGGFALTLHNPFPHTLIALPWLIWLAMHRSRWPLLGATLAGYLVLAPVMVVGWEALRASVAALPAATTGALTGDTAAIAGTNASTLVSAAAKIARLFQVPTEKIMTARIGALVKIWLWAAPLVPLFAFMAVIRSKPDEGGSSESRTFVWLLALSAATTFLGYFLIRFDQGLGWGYRYFHAALWTLPVLATAWMCRAESSSDRGAVWRAHGLIAVVVGLCIITPLHLVTINKIMSFALNSIPPNLPQAERPPGARTLTIIRRQGFCNAIRCDLTHNDPWLRGDIVLFHLRKSSDQVILDRHFPDAKLVHQSTQGSVFVFTEPVKH